MMQRNGESIGQWRAAWVAGVAGLTVSLAVGVASAHRGDVDQPEMPEPAEMPVPTAEMRFYRVTRLLVTYASPDRSLPPLEELVNRPVDLGVTDRGYVGPGMGGTPVRLSVMEFNAQGGGTLEWSAIQAFAGALVKAVNEAGFSVLFVAPSSDQIDQQRNDVRGGRTELNLFVYTGRIEEVRSVSMGQVGAEGAVNRDAPLDRRVRDNSPLQVGDAARQDLLEDYLYRLNRHPGRKVTASLGRADTVSPNRVVLDYQITEVKPWTIFAQVSNTGTESTSRWRQTFGLVHNQLTGEDDILGINYTTASFSKFHAVQASYDRPVIGDVLRLRPFFSYGNYRASDVGQIGQDFSGENWGGGAEVAFNVAQWGPIFLDLTAGLRVQRDRVTNRLLGQTGSATFVLPSAGFRLERYTPAASSLVIVGIEGNVTSPSVTSLTNLGRGNPARSFIITRVNAEQSLYLEPLLGEKIMPRTLAHEVAISFRAQISDYRLPPSFQAVAGGAYSVRGYRESVVAGDSLFVGTLEYRFHVPRALPVFDPEAMSAEYEGGPRQQMLFGSPFRIQPTQDYGITDWDFILKAFVDVGRTLNARKLNFESNQTLVGLGLGAELQVGRNLSIRLDWGVAVDSLRDFLGNQIVRSGSNRLHLTATLAY
jgi:hemolysin activation/secretion protein